MANGNIETIFGQQSQVATQNSDYNSQVIAQGTTNNQYACTKDYQLS